MVVNCCYYATDCQQGVNIKTQIVSVAGNFVAGVSLNDLCPDSMSLRIRIWICMSDSGKKSNKLKMLGLNSCRLY